MLPGSGLEARGASAVRVPLVRGRHQFLLARDGSGSLTSGIVNRNRHPPRTNPIPAHSTPRPYDAVPTMPTHVMIGTRRRVRCARWLVVWRVLDGGEMHGAHVSTPCGVDRSVCRNDIAQSDPPRTGRTTPHRAATAERGRREGMTGIEPA
ncbi:hypothetical protein CURTO8I2_250058 [Curtobacterium sp. 8I-2]|nr:hypothetical protein CURTO8I2_250058 [Curtobacterium sp. 8I-2]